MQDEVVEDGTPDEAPDKRVLIGMVAAGVLAILIAAVAFLSAPDGDDIEDEAVLFGGADLAILLEDAFADDGSGGKTPAVDQMIEEISDRFGVDQVVYEGPSTITGIAPGAPALSAYGHRLLVYVDGFAVGVESLLIGEYKNSNGVSAIAQAE